MRHRHPHYPARQPKAIAIAGTQKTGLSPYLIGATLCALMMGLLLFS